MDHKEAMPGGNEPERLVGSGYVRLLRTNRSYRMLWLAQIVSQAGDWFSFLAVITLVARFTSSAEALGWLLTLRLAPSFLAAPFAGVLADRFNRRNLMIGADLSRVAIALSFTLIDSAAQLPLLYVLTFLQWTFAAIFDPARMALIPSVTSPEERTAANVIGSATWSVMLAVGAALGGLTAGFAGVDVAFVIDGLSFVVAAALVARIPAASGRSATDTASRVDFLGDIREGARYLRARRTLLLYALVKPAMALAGGAMFAIIALQARETFPLGRDGSISLGLLHLSIGVGSGLGPWLGSRLLVRWGETRGNLHRLIAISFILFGVGYGLFGLTGSLVGAIALVILAELGGGGNWVHSTTLLQHGTDDGMRGRVFAVEMAMMNLTNVVTATVGGMLLDRAGLSVPVTTAALGGLQILIGIVALTLLVRAGFRGKRAAGRPSTAY